MEILNRLQSSNALPIGFERLTTTTSAKGNAVEQVWSRANDTIFKKSGEIFYTECGKFFFMCLYCKESCQSGVDIVKHIINSHIDRSKQNAFPEFVSINEVKSEIKMEPEDECTSESRSNSPERLESEDGDQILSTETKSVNNVDPNSTNQIGISERLVTEDVDNEFAPTKGKRPGISQKFITNGVEPETSPVAKKIKIVKLKRIKPTPVLKAMIGNVDLEKSKAMSPDTSNIKIASVVSLNSCPPPPQPMDCVRPQFCYQCKMVPEVHKPTDLRQHICPFCKIWLPNHIYFNLHITDVHKKDPGYLMCSDYHCYVCERRFVSLHTLTLHIERHREPDIFLCSFCGSTHKTKGKLVEHMKQHDGKEFECDQCGKKFRRVGALRQHLWLHEPEPLFVCTVCSKGFKMQRYLDRHMVVHDEPKIPCSRCDAKFHFKTVLRAHERSRHRLL